MKSHILLSLLAAGVVACGEKNPPPPAPKVEAVKPAEAAAPRPPEAPSAAPASAGQDAKPETKPTETPKK